jgi:glycosyltransferase involved in cell wall biosynthesis
MGKVRPVGAGLVSIIVTTKNSERTLRACLLSARAQTYPDVEIIVVDNDSADDTMRIAREFADSVAQGGPERSAQRNIGIREARGTWLLMLDSDMVLDPGVVAESIATAKRCNATGVVIPEFSFGEGFWGACKILERSFYENDGIVTAARFFDREAVVSAGGYDESLTGPEDWDMSIRVCGSPATVFAQTRILHDEGRHSLGSLFVRKFYYGRSMPRFIRKHGASALSRLNPFRPALLRNVFRIFKNPLLGCGLVVMKIVESTGGFLGMLDGRVRSSDVVYRKA